MRQRRIMKFWMLGAIIVGTMIGCGEKKFDVVSTEEVQEEDSQKNKERVEHGQNAMGDEKKNEVENNEEEQNKKDQFVITTEVYEEGDIYIEYPHVENLVNQEITDWYNEKFKNAVDICNEEVEEGDLAADTQYMNETFQVTYQSEDMVSILIQGNYYTQGAAHPYSYMSSYNINLKTGETMGITDEYSPQEILDDIYSGQNYTVLNSDMISEVASSEVTDCAKEEFAIQNRDFMLECLQGCDYNFEVGDDETIKEGDDMVYMYSVRLNDGKWAMGIEVSHVLGDYVIIRYDK